MFLRCSYFLAKSEADVLINSVLIKRKACTSRVCVSPSKLIPSDGLFTESRKKISKMGLSRLISLKHDFVLQ